MLSKLLICLVCLVAINQPALAKPMPGPNFKEAVKYSTVVTAKYLGCIDTSKVDYFSGVNCRFKITKVLKPGMKVKVKAGDTINVNYQFDDGSACIAPKPWKFDKSMMPAKNSSLVLFLNAKVDGIFGTFRGSYGVKKYTAELEKKVLAQSK